MSGPGPNTGRSTSVQVRRTQDTTAPVGHDFETEACYETALPPMSSKQLVLSSHRPQSGLDTSFLLNRTPYIQNPTAGTAGGPSGHRRTGSTLKTVMRKIFNRRRQSQVDNINDSVEEFRRSGASPLLNDKTDSSPRLSKSAGSQCSSPAPQVIEEATTLHDVLERLDSTPRTRRATLPSLIFSDDESRHVLDAVINSNKIPSNRTVSPHANSDPDDVQRRELRKIKRRSRSAGALRGLAKDHRMSPIQWRRRSIESDYVASTSCGMTSDSELSYRPPTRTTVASIPKNAIELSVFEEEEPEVDDESIPPNVGELISSMQNDENASLEQRLTTLEVKLIDLEFAIARMQGTRGETPTDLASRKAPTPDITRHKRTDSTKYSPASVGEGSPNAEQPPGADRPVSTATIRPSISDLHRARALQAASSTSLIDSGSAISVQQYSALVMLLRREQTARRNLEQQVSGLREDIQQLQRMASGSPGIGTMYPIRSVESQEFIRLRPDLNDSPTSSPIRADEKFSSRYESDSDWERSELRPKDDSFRTRWQPTRRIEVANMI